MQKGSIIKDMREKSRSARLGHRRVKTTTTVVFLFTLLLLLTSLHGIATAAYTESENDDDDYSKESSEIKSSSSSVQSVHLNAKLDISEPRSVTEKPESSENNRNRQVSYCHFHDL